MLAALAAVALAPSVARAQGLAPLVVNWEQYFQVDWHVAKRGDGALLTGHVRNVWKDGATWMQLLIDRVDGQGAVIGQRLVWLPSAVPRGNRVYFEIPVEPAASYRVAVFSYESTPRP